MKKNLLSLLFLLAFICFQTAVFAQQDAKQRPISNDTDRVMEMSVVGNKIFIENAPVGKKIEVFSVMGLKVTEIKIETPSVEHTLIVPKGYYILKISDTVRKVVIR
ncbi:MAG: T9SS type A sorting domain-containing protein [Dysgonamonadaceae bacterium]|jgi:hypothetical protein|nr:T9SS type A sorting domain-containing protein [Dysgonamonadaceae bacterium]